MVAIDLLDDAQLLHDRAQAHRRAFNALVGFGENLLWNIRRTMLPDGATHGAELVLDRAILRRTKPVVADIANNLVHALDHIAAAARRQANTGKAGRLYFPITVDDTQYTERIAEAAEFVGAGWAELFTAAREQHRLYLPYLKTIKQLSNEAKHWELRPGMAGALAVQWFAPNHRIEQIPAGHFAAHDSFRFWEGAEAFPNVGVQIVASFRIRGEELDEVDLESVVSTSSNFVANLLGASRAFLDQADAAA
jgi:hypothetical protein